MYNLLAVLQTIVLSYSHLPINQLFQNPLSVSIFLINNANALKDFFKCKLQGFSKAKQQLFLKGGNSHLAFIHQNGSNNKKTSIQRRTYVYLALNHVKLLPLQKYLLENKAKKDSLIVQRNCVQNLICVTQENEVIDNILQANQKCFKDTIQKSIKGIIFCIPFEQKPTQAIKQQIDLYLSISEFFHSHIGLVFSLHEIQESQTLVNLIELAEKQFEEDDDQMLSISSYCRIFQALPFKITYDEIASLAEIKNEYWGETIVIDQGNDGILFWFLYNHSPILIDQNMMESESVSSLKISSAQKAHADKCGLKMTEDKYGHMVFKSKSLLKESLENLSLTVVMVNLKRPEYFSKIEIIFGPIFQEETKRFSKNRVKQREFMICEKIDHEVDRLSELLVEIQLGPCVTGPKKEIEKNKQDEAKQLAYSIKRWLFIKGSE